MNFNPVRMVSYSCRANIIDIYLCVSKGSDHLFDKCFEDFFVEYTCSEEKVQSLFMFLHKINNTGCIIVKVYT